MRSLSRPGLLVSRAEMSSPCWVSRRVMCAVPSLAMVVVAWRLVIFSQHCIALARFLHHQASVSLVLFRFHQIFNPKVSQTSLSVHPQHAKGYWMR